MAGFSITDFRGILPLLDPRKMPPGHAVMSVHADLDASDLRIFNINAFRSYVASNILTQRDGFAFRPNQILVFSGDCEATYGPLRYDNEDDNKVYISAGFQTYPVYTKRQWAIGSTSEATNFYGPPLVYRKLGVPAAPAAPIPVVDPVPYGNVTSDNAGGSWTFANGESVTGFQMKCAADHGLEDRDRVTLTEFAWEELNQEWYIRYDPTVMDPNEFVLADYDYSTFEHLDAEGNAIPYSGGNWKRKYTASEEEDRVYLYTLVTDEGEEGPPSLPSEIVTLVDGQGVTLTTGTSPVVDGAIVATKRFYRTLPTSQGAADYYYVGECPVSQQAFYDDKSHIELGEIIPSLEWYPPPDGLKGLTALPNGVLIGFKDNRIYQCEPYQPHAWPESYERTMDNKIVGIAAFGQHVVVATEENPYLATVTDPLSMTFTKLDTVEPCLSRSAIKSIGPGVLYPSPNGIIYVTSGGAQNILKDIWDRDAWWLRYGTASRIFAHVHNDKYFLTAYFETGTVNYQLVVDPVRDPVELSYLESTNYSGSVVYRKEDRVFYFGRASGPTGPAVYEFDPLGGAPALADWKSRTMVMPQPVNMGAAQIFLGELHPLGTGWVYAIFYADGVFVHSQEVVNDEPFRLPSGFLAREWAVELYTDRAITAVYVAETMDELIGAFASSS